MNASATKTTDFIKLKGIKFGSLNIRSVSRKLDEIELFLHCTKLDYFSLSETWLNHSIGDCELEIPNYTFHRFDRDMESGRHGSGGLLTYFTNKYTFMPIVKWNLCCPDIEWTWSKLTLPRTKPTHVSNIYRPPSGHVEMALNLLESKIQDIYLQGAGDVPILRDVNIDVLKTTKPDTKKYISMLKTLQLDQTVNLPTRITETAATAIDHLVTNREEMYHMWGLLDLGISDHCLVYTCRKMRKIIKTPDRVS